MANACVTDDTTGSVYIHKIVQICFRMSSPEDTLACKQSSDTEEADLPSWRKKSQQLTVFQV